MQALDDGYKGLWATGDMMWELGSEKNFEKLLEYEFALEEVLQKNPALSGVCQYHKDILPAGAIGVAVAAHQSVYVNGTLERVNPFYKMRAAPNHELRPASSAAQINELLDHLQRPKHS